MTSEMEFSLPQIHHTSSATLTQTNIHIQYTCSVKQACLFNSRNSLQCCEGDGGGELEGPDNGEVCCWFLAF